MITISSKYIGEVKDKFSGEYEWTLEDGIQKYIKKEMRDDVI